MHSKFQLFKTVPRPPERDQWRILETVMTSDGPRTRVADGLYYDEDEAIIAFDHKVMVEARK